MKKHFLLKLHPPRPDFPTTMTEAERAVMQQHQAHYATSVRAGITIAVGPVLDPTGVYGVAIVSVDHEGQVRELQERDPVILAGIGFRYECFAMPQLLSASGAK